MITADHQIAFSVGAGCLLAVRSMERSESDVDKYYYVLECRDHIVRLLQEMLGTDGLAVSNQFLAFVSSEMAFNLFAVDVDQFIAELTILYDAMRKHIEDFVTVDLESVGADQDHNLAAQQESIWILLDFCLEAAWYFQKFISGKYSDPQKPNLGTLRTYIDETDTYLGEVEAKTKFDNTIYSAVLDHIISLRETTLERIPIPLPLVLGNNEVSIYLDQVNFKYEPKASHIRSLLNSNKEYKNVKILAVDYNMFHIKLISRILTAIEKSNLESIHIVFLRDPHSFQEHTYINNITFKLSLHANFQEAKIIAQNMGQLFAFPNFENGGHLTIDFKFLGKYSEIQKASDIIYWDTNKEPITSIHIKSVLFTACHFKFLKDILAELRDAQLDKMRISVVFHPSCALEFQGILEMVERVKSMGNVIDLFICDEKGQPLQINPYIFYSDGPQTIFF